MPIEVYSTSQTLDTSKEAQRQKRESARRKATAFLVGEIEALEQVKRAAHAIGLEGQEEAAHREQRRLGLWLKGLQEDVKYLDGHGPRPLNDAQWKVLKKNFPNVTDARKFSDACFPPEIMDICRRFTSNWLSLETWRLQVAGDFDERTEFVLLGWKDEEAMPHLLARWGKTLVEWDTVVQQVTKKERKMLPWNLVGWGLLFPMFFLMVCVGLFGFLHLVGISHETLGSPFKGLLIVSMVAIPILAIARYLTYRFLRPKILSAPSPFPV